MKKSGASQGQSASQLISKRIAELGDWRGETLSRMRKLIKEADPDVGEEWKWMGSLGGALPHRGWSIRVRVAPPLFRSEAVSAPAPCKETSVRRSVSSSLTS